MSPDEQQEPTLAEEHMADLKEILDTELGQLAPVEKYHRPLADEERAALQEELDAVEPAHAAAAARLHTLYAD